MCGTNQYQMFSWFDHRISLVFAFFVFAVLEQAALTEDSSKHNSLIYERSVLNQSLPTLVSGPLPHTVNAGNRRHFPPFF